MSQVCKMLRHIACTDTLQVNTRYAEINLRIYGPQVVTAAQTLAMHPQSKIAREHMEGEHSAFSEAGLPYTLRINNEAALVTSPGFFS